MKKVFTLMALISVGTLLSAQLILQENFSGYANEADLEVAYNAEGYNYATEWYPSFKSGDRNGVSPKVMDGALTYDGYALSGIGKSVVFSASAESTDARISTRRVLLEGGLSSKLYVSFLVNITGAQTGIRDFFTFEGSTGSSFTRGRVFAQINNVEEVDQLKFGISKNSSSSDVVVMDPTIYAPNTTYLVVVVYEVVEGGDNDLIHMYVNPNISGDEAANSALKLTSVDTQSDYSESTPVGINIRQRGVGAKISGIRVSNDWASLWTAIPTSIANNKVKDLSAWVSGKNLILNNNESGTLSIYDLTGSEMMKVKVDGNETLHLNLPNAMYVVKYVAVNGEVSTTKVILR